MNRAIYSTLSSQSNNPAYLTISANQLVRCPWLVIGLILMASSCTPKNPQVESSHGDETDTPQSGTIIHVSSTPIPLEDIGVNRYFYHPEMSSLLRNGSFENWSTVDMLPHGWHPLASKPSIERVEDKSFFGDASLKIVGSPDSEARIACEPTIDRAQLRGQELTFGAWLNTERPSKVRIEIIDNWKKYHVAKPTTPNEWELVRVTATVPTEANSAVHFAIAIVEPDGEETVCYVDGAALVLGSPIP